MDVVLSPVTAPEPDGQATVEPIVRLGFDERNAMLRLQMRYVGSVEGAELPEFPEPNENGSTFLTIEHAAGLAVAASVMADRVGRQVRLDDERLREMSRKGRPVEGWARRDALRARVALGKTVLTQDNATSDAFFERFTKLEERGYGELVQSALMKYKRKNGLIR